MANGMPISAITGRGDVMALLEKDVFFYTTFGGEALSLAASVACIDFLRQNEVPQRLALAGERLLSGLNGLIRERGLDYVSVAGYPFRTLMNFSPSAGEPLKLKTLVQQELIRRGILWSGIHNLSFSHTDEDIDYTIAAFGEAFGVLEAAVATGRVDAALRGAPLQPVFRKTSQFHTKPRPTDLNESIDQAPLKRNVA
jgi:glutamate-1-semialdehyde aminotransferase